VHFAAESVEVRLLIIVQVLAIRPAQLAALA